MSARLTCPDCQAALEAPDAARGKTVACPKCGARALVEGAAEETAEPAPRYVAERPVGDRPGPRPALPDRQGPGRGRRRPGPEHTDSGLPLALSLGGFALLLLVAGGALLAFLMRWSGPAPSEADGTSGFREADWVTFAPRGGDFRVEVPGAPTTSALPEPGQVTVKYTYVHRPTQTTFVVSYLDSPHPTVSPAVLGAAERDAQMKASPGSRVVREGAISLGAHPGWEVELESPNRERSLHRTYTTRNALGHRIYHFQTGGPYTQPGKGDAERFFGSFRLGPSPAAPDEANPAVTSPTPQGELFTLRPSEHQPVLLAVFSPDGTTLAAAGVGDLVRLFDGHTGAPKGTFGGQKGPVQALTFSRDGRSLAHGGFDRAVRIRDGSTGREMMTMSPGAVRWWFADLAYSADGSLLAGAFDRTLLVLTPPVGNDPLQLPFPSQVTAVRFAPSGRRIAVGLTEGRVQVRDLGSGREVNSFDARTRPVLSVAFSPDGQTVAGCWDDNVSLWDTTQNREVAVLKGARTVRKLAYSSDGWLLAAGCDRGVVRVWEAASRRHLADFPHEGRVVSLAFSRAGDRLASVADGRITVWDVPRALQAGRLGAPAPGRP
jgi:hypothetical protein